MAEFPLDPQLAKMVVASPEFRSQPLWTAASRARALAAMLCSACRLWKQPGSSTSS